MNKSNIFFQFKENTNIQKQIFNTGNKHDSFQYKLDQYIATKAYYFIKYHNPELDFKSYDIYQYPQLPNIVFVLIITKTNLNHPYMMFLNMDDVYIMFLIPFGRERKQADINAYYNSINNASNIEKIAIYLLIEKTIIIRKKGIIESNQFSLIQCSNISNCIRRYHEIDKMHINNNEKIKLKEKAREFYLNKAIEFIKTFFILLDNKNYDEAYNFLKGNDTNYFGKQRLNTFFKNTKSIIGHLEIFITLYQLFFYIKTVLLS